MTINADEYFAQLEMARDKSSKRLLKMQESSIMRIYDKAFMDAYEDLMKYADNPKHLETAAIKAKTAYVKQLADELRKNSDEFNKKISKNAMSAYVKFYKEVYPEFADSEFSKRVDAAVNIINKKSIDSIIKGKIYKDGRGLSDRIWKSANSAGDRINDAIASCMARGIGSAETAKIIKEFGTGGHRIWDRAKIREKLGDGYARKYGTSGIDYESLRLARTTQTHLQQINSMNAVNVNPYVGGFIWRSSHSDGRTCKECKEREGNFFTVKEVPFDHPNGMCRLESAFMINGKIATPKAIGEDIGKWVRGEPNSGAMDKLYKDVPKMDVQQTKKSPSPEKSPEEATNNKNTINLQAVQDFNNWLDKNSRASNPSEYYRLKKLAQAEWDEYYKRELNRVNKQYKILSREKATELSCYRFLTTKEQQVYKSYVATSASFRINAHLYNGNYKKGVSMLDDKIDALTELIGKTKIDSDTKFVRFQGFSALGDLLKGVNAKPFSENNECDLLDRSASSNTLTELLMSLNAQAVGKTYKSKSFTSVSYNAENNVFTNRPVKLEIFAPKGATAMYTANHSESEVVLQRDTNYKVLGFDIEENNRGKRLLKVLLEVIVK